MLCGAWRAGRRIRWAGFACIAFRLITRPNRVSRCLPRLGRNDSESKSESFHGDSSGLMGVSVKGRVIEFDGEF